MATATDPTAAIAPSTASASTTATEAKSTGGNVTAAVSASSSVSGPAAPVVAVSVTTSDGSWYHPYRHFLGGAIGGMTAAVITSPLEVVKTRLQVSTGKDVLTKGGNGTFSVMRSIVRNESVRGLWRGITPTLVGIIPARAVYFGSYSRFKEGFANHDLNGRLYNLLSAAGAGAISATAVCPIWVVKTRLQLLPAHTISTKDLVGKTASKLQRLPPRPNVLSLGISNLSPAKLNATAVARANNPFSFGSIHQVAMDMYRKEGLRAFFRGLTASYWGITESAVQFALYEECKDWMEEPSSLKYFVAAGACKLVASVVTYPHEVVRTRMRDQRSAVNSSQAKYRGMFQSIGVIFREEGARGLYGGMPAHLMRVVPNAAIMFLVVELCTNSSSS